MKISPRWQTCRNSREKATRTPLLELRAGKVYFCETDFERPCFRGPDSCISSKGTASTTSSLYTARPNRKIYGGSTPETYAFCLGCSSTTHIVLAMIHGVHVATIRVWQGKAQSVCTFLPRNTKLLYHSQQSSGNQYTNGSKHHATNNIRLANCYMTIKTNKRGNSKHFLFLAAF